MAPYSMIPTKLSHPLYQTTTPQWDRYRPQPLREQKQRADGASSTALPSSSSSSRPSLFKPGLINDPSVSAPKEPDKDDSNELFSFFNSLSKKPASSALVKVSSPDSDGTTSMGSDSGSESECESGDSDGGNSNSSESKSGSEDESGTENGSEEDEEDEKDEEDEESVDEIQTKQQSNRQSQGIDFRFLDKPALPPSKKPLLLPWESSTAIQSLKTLTLPRALPPKPQPKPQGTIKAPKPVPAAAKPLELPWLVKPNLAVPPESAQGKPVEPKRVEAPSKLADPKRIKAPSRSEPKRTKTPRRPEPERIGAPQHTEQKKLEVPKPVKPETPAARSQYVPSKLARSKMATRPNLDDEAAFFRKIESCHLSRLGSDFASSASSTSSKTSTTAKPTTKLWSQPGTGTPQLAPFSSPKPRPARPPLPSQKTIQEATCRSLELLRKNNAKRRLDQSRAEAEARLKKRTKLGDANAPPPTKSILHDLDRAKVKEKEKPKPPIDSDRTVIQYTVFETQRLPLPFDGHLRDKVLRRESFLDKHKANVFAARLMPKAEYVQSSAAILRIEADYGKDDAERDGMFLGRVYYRRGKDNDRREEIKFVYVDREMQQLGKMSVADLEEVSRRELSAEYVDTFLAARYDVFVVLRKATRPDDGRVVVYKYDESEPKIHTREDVDADDSDEEVEGEADTEEVDGMEEPRCDEQETEPASRRLEQTGQAEQPEQSQPSLGSHFEHLLQGSYTTLQEANSKAIDAFEEWTRPPSDRPRLDAVIYYRDYVKPDIAQRRAVFDADDGSENAEMNKRDVESVELSWEPPAQFGYTYSSLSVVVAKSQIQGPLDLTGAFQR